jgi:Glycosyltransferase family 87
LNATRYKRSPPAELPGTSDRSRARRLTIAIYLGGLVGLGLASALVYALGITARYPLAAGLLIPRAGWYRLSGRSLHAGFTQAVVYALLILGYVVALRLALGLAGHHARATIVVIAGGWLLCSIVLLGAYPGESLDIFDYLFRGRMLAEFGASPLASTPTSFNHRPFYEYITWRGQVDTYGPLWEYASGTVAWIVHHVFGRADSLAAYILGYRLLAIVLTGICGALIATIVRRHTPDYVPAALLIWLWNPLLLVTTAIGAHNDMLMLVALLAALLLFQRRYWVGGLLALVLAAHVKLTALLLLPVLGLWLVQRCGWRRAIRSSLIALVVAIPLSWLLYAPLGGWVTLRRMLSERARFLVNSPANLVYRVLQERWGWAEADAWRVATQGATALFFVIAAALIWLWWNQRRLALDQRQTLADEHAWMAGADAEGRADALLWCGCVIVTLVYLLVGSFWFQHWYLLGALAPAALLPASRWSRALLPAYCLGALWSDLANSFLIILPARPLSVTQVGAVNVLAQVLPLLSVLVLTLLGRRVLKLRMRTDDLC